MTCGDDWLCLLTSGCTGSRGLYVLGLLGATNRVGRYHVSGYRVQWWRRMRILARVRMMLVSLRTVRGRNPWPTASALPADGAPAARTIGGAGARGCAAALGLRHMRWRVVRHSGADGCAVGLVCGTHCGPGE